MPVTYVLTDPGGVGLELRFDGTALYLGPVTVGFPQDPEVALPVLQRIYDAIHDLWDHYEAQRDEKAKALLRSMNAHPAGKGRVIPLQRREPDGAA